MFQFLVFSQTGKSGHFPCFPCAVGSPTKAESSVETNIMSWYIYSS